MIEEHNPVMNVEELIQKIREEAANLQGIASSARTKKYTDATNLLPSIGYIESLLRNAESRAYTRTKWPDKLNRFPFTLNSKLQKIVLKLINFFFKDQREVNFNFIFALKESLTINRQLIAQITSLKTQMDEHLGAVDIHFQRMDERIQQMDERLGAVDIHFQRMDERIQQMDERLGAVDIHFQRMDERIQQMDERLGAVDIHFQRMDERIQQMDERLGAVDIHFQRMDERIQQMDERLDVADNSIQQLDERHLRDDSYLKNDLIQQKRLIALFLEQAQKRLSQPFNKQQLQSFVNEKPHFLDAFYVAFEDKFRGKREDIYHRLKIYLPLIKSSQAGIPEFPILDVGCGRGEWLELLREAGYTARGIDINRVMLAQCKSRGLEVTEADVITYLQALPDASLSAITGFHIIEHLSFETLVQLFDEIVRVLKSKGLVIFETPNTRNILVGSGDFYRDPTHINPIHPDTISFLAESRGLINSQSYFFEEHESKLHLVSSSKIKFNDLNDYVQVSRDMVLIAYKA
ncbi:MAG: methyltransferase domain-containing protein [Nodularia sp. (in: Bacteria)]|nr:MAG: methyltransferase domain-containing protein [Nodularia sp. (in: cyanobacteria)]